MNPEPLISVPKAWLERLAELNRNCKNSRIEVIGRQYLMLLHGYIESAEYLLASKAEDLLK